MQKLTLPLNNAMMQAGYKSEMYRKEWGWKHYGVDLTDTKSRDLYALGDGTVIAAGQDGETLTGPKSRLGNVLVIVYRDVELHDGTVMNLACRMYHLERIAVKVGQTVTRDTVVGQYGNTGANTTGAHLHIELDKDINWPTLAPGVSVGAGRIINTADKVKAAGGVADSTIDPAKVWNKRKGQTLDSKWVGSWVNKAELDIPVLNEETKDEEIKRLRDAITAYEAERNKVLYLLEEAEDLLAETRSLLNGGAANG